MCRAVFNLVERRQFVNGPTISTYAVDDKQQAADTESTLFGETDSMDQDDDEPEPCLVCGGVDSSHEVMFCDSCSHTVHVFCAGYQDAPEEWYCETCTKPWEASTTHRQTRPVAIRDRGRLSRRRGQPAARAQRTARQPEQTTAWARVWQTVWDRLNLDLDFPYDESDSSTNVRRSPLTRAANEAAWRRRYNVANQQGAARRFQEAAAPMLETKPESQEELRAWNAFEKARDLQTGDTAVPRRKRGADTASPAATPPPQEERPFKRPRTKHSQRPRQQTIAAESSAQASRRVTSAAPMVSPNGVNFFSALVDEVEQQPVLRPTLPEEAILADGQLSPPLTSPAASPLNASTPLTAATSPPPLLALDAGPSRAASPDRPISPLLSEFSPYSPVHVSTAAQGQRFQSRGRQNSVAQSPASRHNASHSPSAHLSYSTKTEIQRMVKAALGSRYKDKRMTKDQYTVINRNVSRMLYEEIGDAGALSEQADRDKWQAMASNAVARELDKLEKAGET